MPNSLKFNKHFHYSRKYSKSRYFVGRSSLIKKINKTIWKRRKSRTIKKTKNKDNSQMFNKNKNTQNRKENSDFLRMPAIEMTKYNFLRYKF